jgi:hypothetical protein
VVTSVSEESIASIFRVSKFKYELEATLTKEQFKDEIRRKINSGNTTYYTVSNSYHPVYFPNDED